VRSALVDGYIMFCTPEDDERLKAVIARGLPYVLVDYSPNVPGPRVNIDDRGGARAVAQHLVDLGHRRFGIILPFEKWGFEIPYGNDADGEATALSAEELSNPNHVTDYRRWRCFIRHERLLGWREPLEAAGVDWASVPVASAPEGDAETGYRAAARLLDRADRPTAIISLSDVLAFGAMRAASERGIRVPQDLSIVGFDDIAEAASASLTTVWQPHATKGEEAVRLLAEGGDDVVLPTELVVRASSGPAPN
jgi:DNA-binding LacI/PurR family transcriptional regulator